MKRFSLFVIALLCLPAIGQVDITGVGLTNGVLHLTWNGGNAPWTVEAHNSIAGTNWTTLTTANTPTATVSASGDHQFFRVAYTPVIASTTARYRMTFVNTWSVANPADYPFPGTAHYTTFAGTTHNDSFSMWATGALATPGMERLAELGATSTAVAELNAAVTAGTADQLLNFPGFFPPGVNQTSVEFDINLTHSKVSFASMVAPSPDWFVGVSAVDLIDSGDWVDSLNLPARVYDAGTETGEGFSLSNPAESPHQPISRYAPFVNAFGVFSFQRIDN